MKVTLFDNIANAPEKVRVDGGYRIFNPRTFTLVAGAVVTIWLCMSIDGRGGYVGVYKSSIHGASVFGDVIDGQEMALTIINHNNFDVVIHDGKELAILMFLKNSFPPMDIVYG